MVARGQALAAADLAETVLGRWQAGEGADVERDLLIARGDLLAGTVRAAEAEMVYREVLAEFEVTRWRSR